MPKKNHKHLFTKYGKQLTSYHELDSVFTIAVPTKNTPVETIDSLIAPPIPTFFDRMKEYPRGITTKITDEISILKQRNIRMIPTMWAASTATLAAMVVVLVATGMPSIHRIKNEKYSIFSSKPLTLSSTTARLFGGTTESAALDAVFESYNCPLQGTGKIFVKEAEKNNIPFWFVAAISFQESGCGRKTPKMDGVEETYNAWGWGVWGDNLRTFKNWEEGIKKVSEYLGDNFFSKGITDPCEIMKIYTPPSDGSWCAGVKYFGEIISGYQTPEK